jgi:hypothetical protein
MFARRKTTRIPAGPSSNRRRNSGDRDSASVAAHGKRYDPGDRRSDLTASVIGPSSRMGVQSPRWKGVAAQRTKLHRKPATPAATIASHTSRMVMQAP